MMHFVRLRWARARARQRHYPAAVVNGPPLILTALEWQVESGQTAARSEAVATENGICSFERASFRGQSPAATIIHRKFIH